jgi:hypothetical protein
LAAKSPAFGGFPVIGRLIRRLLRTKPARPPVPEGALAKGIPGPWAARYFSITTSEDESRPVRDWDDVEGAFAYFDDGDPAFVILQWAEDEYVQVGGTLDELTVETRRSTLWGYVHEVLRPAGRVASTQESRVECVGGYIRIREGEAMTREEAKGVFLHSFEHAEIPDGFAARRKHI